jgi:hypothetical protein
MIGKTNKRPIPGGEVPGQPNHQDQVRQGERLARRDSRNLTRRPRPRGTRSNSAGPRIVLGAQPRSARCQDPLKRGCATPAGATREERMNLAAMLASQIDTTRDVSARPYRLKRYGRAATSETARCPSAVPHSTRTRTTPATTAAGDEEACAVLRQSQTAKNPRIKIPWRFIGILGAALSGAA